MYSSGVSKDKFAFIVQSMAPTMASFIPVSSWIGAQIGYASSGFQYCDSNNDSEFTIIIKTLPYRFLPFLTFYCVILVCVLNRDFACMLVSEKKNYVEHRALSSQGERTPPPGEMKGTSDTSQSDIEDLFEGPLAPKKGTPFRWFNAVIPFLIVIVFTFVGMILDGWSTINSNNDDLRNDHINMTVMNIFGNADAIAAVIWSTCLATFVIILLVLIQRILKFTECMNAWIEGVKDVIEPLFILILAWGLGNVIAEIQTSSFIAEILRSGNISYHYIPVITTIIGYFMAYCTGSAFGTMGILFPLVIPTTCQLTDDEDIQVQAAAAILSSCIFGNLMSPIADLTVLTRVSTQCDLNSHIKTCSPYILLVGFITIVFGALPVGAGWYPWYVAWIVMATILTAFFICFSTGHASASRSLFKIGCPCVYNVLNHVAEEISLKYYVVKTKLSSKIHSRLHSRLHSRRHQLNADDTVQTEEASDLDLLLNEEAETAPVSRTNNVS
jgi:Na+/H+ antiporter NhaC